MAYKVNFMISKIQIIKQCHKTTYSANYMHH